MIEAYGYIAAYFLAGTLFLFLVLGIARLLRPHRPNPEKLSTYESGEQPMGNANVRFNPRFYLFALFFVLFELELVFLFPWALVFKEPALQEMGLSYALPAMLELLLFVFILALGLALVWKKGYLDWEKPKVEKEPLNSPVPPEAYRRYQKTD